MTIDNYIKSLHNYTIEKIEYNDTFIRFSIYLDRSGWSELLQYFWSNGEICKEDNWVHKQ